VLCPVFVPLLLFRLEVGIPVHFDDEVLTRTEKVR
jgi:hypothetical protein